MKDFADKVEDASGDAAEKAREKLASDHSNADEETLNEKLGRAHLDHNDNDDKFGGND